MVSDESTGRIVWDVGVYGRDGRYAEHIDGLVAEDCRYENSFCYDNGD